MEGPVGQKNEGKDGNVGEGEQKKKKKAATDILMLAYVRSQIEERRSIFSHFIVNKCVCVEAAFG